jgi:flagella basal body P-ring formation protein FlgA
MVIMSNLFFHVLRFLTACAGICFGLGLPAQAQMDAAAAEAQITQPLRAWLDASLLQTEAMSPAALKVSVHMGSLDPRLRLAACQKIEPFLPTGSRLWGKTRVGLRCVEGAAKWQVFLPVQVKALGKAWVLRRDVPAGASLGEADVMQAEVDWAEEASPVLAQSADWLGLVATRALGTGQTLRQSMVRAPQVFQAGSLVRVLAQGGGFQVSADAQAVSAGVVGQPAKVRMDNGRVLTGTVVDARTVKIDL